ncbi:hypothetical protein KC343_g14682 [Hortaea werneckii]|uniref:Uncharacterized protein n=1 Tax=Hortaea werneckii TaxID=91943 RepID=A0A3M7CD36_HORWE|nr:hypothetical protein KC352_g32441 [Hortaea werneckii]KAI7555739.1 hypothetical protein KC317_g12748 [Hortaea werneckii]KAI7597878.1 hypothetical protein KC346_g14491 [Hortaea werneckii]KAI7602942.1 hypothetical protein KC343_g14682 [Hortaea werneckii]KAI7649781.1 hypothetical protein KC319_g11179 [Hortaea werneckii]
MQMLLIIALALTRQTFAQSPSSNDTSAITSPPASRTETYTFTAAANISSSTYACNPAHQYPGGQVCVSTADGSLTLVSATTTATAPTVSASAAGDCKSEHKLCMSSTDPQSAGCGEQLANCQAVCKLQYTACRSSGDPNEALCASVYAGCLGSNPFGASNGTMNGTGMSSSGGPMATGVGNGSSGGGSSSETSTFQGGASGLKVVGGDVAIALVGFMVFLVAL